MPSVAENSNGHNPGKKDKSGIITTEIAPFEGRPEVKAYPNPFSEKLRFEFVSPLSTRARIDIYDMTGRKIQTAFDAEIESNKRARSAKMRIGVRNTWKRTHS